MAIKRPDTPLATTPKPTYVNLGLARSAVNTAAGKDINTPATAKDSADYRKGYAMGLKGKKVSAIENKYQGKNQYVEKGRWEGQNANKVDDTYFPTVKAKVGSNKKKK
jgi:hypothetical protein